MPASKCCHILPTTKKTHITITTTHNSWSLLTHSLDFVWEKRPKATTAVVLVLVTSTKFVWPFFLLRSFLFFFFFCFTTFCVFKQNIFLLPPQNAGKNPNRCQQPFSGIIILTICFLLPILFVAVGHQQQYPQSIPIHSLKPATNLYMLHVFIIIAVRKILAQMLRKMRTNFKGGKQFC